MTNGPRNIVILTGAGISAESGLDTFRDKGGLWSQVNLEDVATPDGFRRDPVYVLDFHDKLRRGLVDVEPNPAHQALARLESAHDGDVLVVTQNVDDLHERAGTKNLIHMHGELYKARCEACGAVHDWRGDLGLADACGRCGHEGRLRPHVTWFYEEPMEMARIHQALIQCDLFVSIGTSGNVYPAAGFVADIRAMGRARAVELNLEPSEGASVFHTCINGPASQVVPAFVDELLSA